jgi:hypothetical protein
MRELGLREARHPFFQICDQLRLVLFEFGVLFEYSVYEFLEANFRQLLRLRIECVA